MTVQSVRTLADEVQALLQAIQAVNYFHGEVNNPPLDPDGRVHAYVIGYFGSGVTASNRAGGVTPRALTWSFQITCAGGDPTRALWCIDEVREALGGKRLSRGGALREVGDPGPLRRDDDVSPPRHYLPLTFQLFIG